MDYQIYDLIIDETTNDFSGTEFVALVDKPAFKRDFLTFAEKLQFEIQDQQIVTGPLIVPQQLIYRDNATLGQHYVKFSRDTIKKIAIKFAKNGYQKNVNLMHDPALKVDGVTMFESFISDSTRGIKPIEAFKDLPDGTWFGSFFVENMEVWQLIKSGKLNGYSVEGLFDYGRPQSESEIKLKELQNILNKIK